MVVMAVSELVGWLDKLANGTDLSNAQADVSTARREISGLQAQRVAALDAIAQAKAQGQAIPAYLTNALAGIDAAIEEFQGKLSTAQGRVSELQRSEVAQQQAQPGWQGPRQGEQATVSGAGVAAAVGVGRYRVSQEFGEHPNEHGYGAQGHQGIDVATPMGTAVDAAFTGMASIGFDKNGYGKYIKLVDEKGQALILGHLSAYAAGLDAQIKAAGGRLLVSQGQRIGYTGSTGNSTGPHLHLEGRTAQGNALGVNRPVDPRTLDYAGMNRPAFQAGTSGTTPPDWDKLLAKAKELHDTLVAAAPGQARILAQQQVDQFQKMSDAAKAAYSEIDRQASAANKKVKETDAQREARIYREKVAMDSLTASLRGASDERLKELSAQGIQGQSLQKCGPKLPGGTRNGGRTPPRPPVKRSRPPRLQPVRPSATPKRPANRRTRWPVAPPTALWKQPPSPSGACGPAATVPCRRPEKIRRPCSPSSAPMHHA
jgi:murein DD-endopeptidase MepM/ murein hydrolase activator NlpD